MGADAVRWNSREDRSGGILPVCEYGIHGFSVVMLCEGWAWGARLGGTQLGPRCTGDGAWSIVFVMLCEGSRLGLQGVKPYGAWSGWEWHWLIMIGAIGRCNGDGTSPVWLSAKGSTATGSHHVSVIEHQKLYRFH